MGRKPTLKEKRNPDINSHMEEGIRLNYMGKIVIKIREKMIWREAREISISKSSFAKFIYAVPHSNFSFGFGSKA